MPSVLPESTTANVVYDLGVAVSLALGDLADAVEVAVERGIGVAGVHVRGRVDRCGDAGDSQLRQQQAQPTPPPATPGKTQ